MPNYSVIIAASGHGKRFSNDIPKQYTKLSNNQTVLERCVQSWRAVQGIKKIIVVVAAEAQKLYPHPTGADIVYVLGGSERAHSVYAGLNVLKNESDDHWVFVHDAARPVFDVSDVDQLMSITKNHPVGGILVAPVKDTLRHRTAAGQLETVPRSDYFLALTPQLFRRKVLQTALSEALAHQRIPTDEAQAIEWSNQPYLTLTARFYPNKITYPVDTLNWKEPFMHIPSRSVPKLRIGHGYDLHQLAPGAGLKLAGHYINCPYRIVAHSDGDVVLHALCDALLGALSLGDIGRLFPDTDPQYQRKDSQFFLSHVYALVKNKAIL